MREKFYIFLQPQGQQAGHMVISTFPEIKCRIASYIDETNLVTSVAFELDSSFELILEMMLKKLGLHGCVIREV